MGKQVVAGALVTALSTVDEEEEEAAGPGRPTGI